MSEAHVRYPEGLDDDSTLLRVTDRAETILVYPLSATDMIIQVESTEKFPDVGYLTIEEELIKYDSKSSDQFFVTVRGAQGTTPSSHSRGCPVSLNIIAIHHNILKDAIISIERELGPNIKGEYSSLKERIEKLIETFLVTEDLTDQISPDKTIFKTTYKYIPKTLKVWINGLKERGVVEVDDTHFQIDPPLEIGESLEVEYIRKISI